MLITFSGLDGSGKTTQIGLFLAYLKEKGYRYKKLTMYDDISFSGLLAKIKSKKKQNTNRLKGYRYDKNRKDRHLVFFRKLIYMIDLMTYKYKTWRHGRLNNSILIMDRCFYDTLANLHNTGSEAYTNMMLALTPKADISIFLDANPETAFKRKPEYPPESYKERRDAYLEIFKKTKGKIIESERNIEEIQYDIRRIFQEKKR